MSATRSPLTLPCSNFVPASHNPDSAHPLSNDTADEERLARWKLMARVTLEPSKGQRSDGTAAPPSTPLLTGAGLSISASERLCPVGRNGSGKSTLLKIAVGQVEPDAHSRFVQPSVTIRYLLQARDGVPTPFMASGEQQSPDASPRRGEGVACP